MSALATDQHCFHPYAFGLHTCWWKACSAGCVNERMYGGCVEEVQMVGVFTGRVVDRYRSEREGQLQKGGLVVPQPNSEESQHARASP